MTPTETESMINEALLVQLKALVLSPVLPVAWPDQPFSKPADNKYLRIDLLPNDTGRFLISSDGPHRYFGIMQLTLVTSADDGILGPREIAGRVARHFAADTKMKFGGLVVRSFKNPTVGQSMADAKTTSDLLTPISVEYETYV